MQDLKNLEISANRLFFFFFQIDWFFEVRKIVTTSNIRFSDESKNFPHTTRRRERIIVPKLRHFGDLNSTYFGNFGSAKVTMHTQNDWLQENELPDNEGLPENEGS